MNPPPLDPAVATIEADAPTSWPRTFVDREFGQLLSRFRSRHPGASSELIERSFAMANDRHRGQLRKSGEPYVSHPIAVATIQSRSPLIDAMSRAGSVRCWSAMARSSSGGSPD